ncbi:MAG: FecR domain-containing protein [Planctomycetes bacterium]|nr:FecR domain-containing protein [Planctomycetota bacterium]
MKPCEVHHLEELADLAAGRLDESTAENLRRHLVECQSCRQAAARLATLDEALRRCDAMQPGPVPEADRQRILDAARQMLAAQPSQDTAAARLPVLVRLWNRPEVRRALAAAAVVAIIAAAAVMAVRSVGTSLGPAVARAVDVRGSVSVNGNGDTQLRSQQRLHVGQQIRTGRQSMLTLAMTGGAEVDLNESTALTIEQSDMQSTRCRLDQGQVFVKLSAAGSSGRMVLDTSVARVEATAAEFDLRLVPGTVASRCLRSGGTFVLAAATVQVLGEPAAPTELRLTVLSGQVELALAGDPAPVVVKADEQVCYDPRGARPVSVKVRAEEHVLWRLPDDRVYRLAAGHLSELYAAKVTPQQQDRVRLDYDFLSSRELDDWRVDGTGWTLMLNALRCRNGQGEIVSQVAFLGDVEVEFTANIEPQDGSLIGWQFRPDASQGFDPVTAVARLQTEPDRRLRTSLAFGNSDRPSLTRILDGQVFRFGGRLEGNRTYLSLDGDDVAEAATPDAILAALHDKDNPQPLRVAIRAQGDDLFISNLTVIGRPDPRWLRQRLQRLLDRPSPDR